MSATPDVAAMSRAERDALAKAITRANLRERYEHGDVLMALNDGGLMDALRNSPRVFPQRSLLAIVPATKGRDRIIQHYPTMQPTYDLMRAQIRAVE